MNKPKRKNSEKPKGIQEPWNPRVFVILHLAPFLNSVAPFFLSYNWKRLGRPQRAIKSLLLKVGLILTLYMSLLSTVYSLRDTSVPMGTLIVFFVGFAMYIVVIPIVEIVWQSHVYKEMNKVKNDALRQY